MHELQQPLHIIYDTRALQIDSPREAVKLDDETIQLL